MELLDFHRAILSHVLLPSTEPAASDPENAGLPPSALIVAAPGLGLMSHVLPSLFHVYSTRSALVLLVNATEDDIASFNAMISSQYVMDGDGRDVSWLDSDTPSSAR